MNLSAWALRHRALTLYLILAVAAAGVWAYLSLGRAEDPPFTIKQMVVQVDWPGASAEQMARSVVDRLERKLEEVPSLDYVESNVQPGHAILTVSLRDNTPPADVSGHLVSGAQEGRGCRADAAARGARSLLQRRIRRCLRHYLCLYRGRIYPAGIAPCGGGCARRPAAGAGRRQDRPGRRPGRAPVYRFLSPQTG